MLSVVSIFVIKLIFPLCILRPIINLLRSRCLTDVPYLSHLLFKLHHLQILGPAVFNPSIYSSFFLLVVCKDLNFHCEQSRENCPEQMGIFNSLHFFPAVD